MVRLCLYPPSIEEKLMKPARYLIAIILLCLAGLATTATTATAADVPQGFAAPFVQTRTLPGFDDPLVSHGEMRFSADGGFHWQIDKPYHYVFDMQGDEAHEELPDGTRRTLKPDQTPWLKAVQRMFVGALSGDEAQLARYFEVEITPLADGRRMSLVPKPGAMAKVVKRIQVTESAPGQPRHMVIDEVSGAHMDIRFSPHDAASGN